jgi:hypothetical protein
MRSVLHRRRSNGHRIRQINRWILARDLSWSLTCVVTSGPNNDLRSESWREERRYVQSYSKIYSLVLKSILYTAESILIYLKGEGLFGFKILESEVRA